MKLPFDRDYFKISLYAATAAISVVFAVFIMMNIAEIYRMVLEIFSKSFELAKRDGYRKFIMFLHYPPTNILQTSSVFTDMAEEYGAEQVIYAHTHGSSRFHDSIEGKLNGVEYTLVSGDYRKWKPYKVI